LISARAALRPTIAARRARGNDRDLNDRRAKSTAAKVFLGVAELKNRHAIGNSFE
jgi:hypothetical protein